MDCLNYSGFAPWTALLGDETPCFSYIAASATLPPLASNTNSMATNKPTVIVAGAVYAMQFPVQEAADTLSAGAIAGITIGVAGAISLAAGLAILCFRRQRVPERPPVQEQAPGKADDVRSSYYTTDTAASSNVPIPVEVLDLRPGSEMSGIQGEECNSGVNLGKGAGGLSSHPPTLRALAWTEGTEREKGAADDHVLEDDDNISELYLPRSLEPLPLSLPFSLGQTPNSELGEGQDDGYPLPRTASTIGASMMTADEVQLARPQRLSRGYARIVYTHGQQGSGSSSSMHSSSGSERQHGSPRSQKVYKKDGVGGDGSSGVLWSSPYLSSASLSSPSSSDASSHRSTRTAFRINEENKRISDKKRHG